MEELGVPLSVKYSFSNFSYKVNYYLKKIPIPLQEFSFLNLVFDD
jgi:hypothetical protein